MYTLIHTSKESITNIEHIKYPKFSLTDFIYNPDKNILVVSDMQMSDATVNRILERCNLCKKEKSQKVNKL